MDQDTLARIRNAGFNRLSLGIQSFDDEYLASIGRVHCAEQAINAYLGARRAGFTNIGLDLIFALPGQSLSHWGSTLDKAIELEPKHVSLYELTIEEGTRFGALCAAGQLDLPDKETQISMYELAIEKLAEAGFEHYEVSNFARPGFRSRHNQVYWRNDPYYGFGAGATSYVDNDRARRNGNPATYIDAITSGGDAVEFSEHLIPRDRAAETLIQGLRMIDGISLSAISGQTGIDAAQVFAAEIARLVGQGLIDRSNDTIKVTHKGLLLLNDVAQEFLSLPS